jgi:hypothetical protein
LILQYLFMIVVEIYSFIINSMLNLQQKHVS